MNVHSDEFLAQQASQVHSFHPSGESTPFAQSALEASIGARFAEMAARYPARLAVWHEAVQLTYAELDQRANGVAQQILAQPSDATQPVILLFGHTPAAVIAMLGVWKAGRFYTPFDPTQPVARLAQKATDSAATLLLTDAEHQSLAQEVNRTAATILCIDDRVDAIAADSSIDELTIDPQLPIPADAPALLLYTSGSTGQPKGILLSQRALLHRVKRQQAIVHLGCEDRCACVHTYDAIAGLRDLLCPLLNGAATYLFDLKTRSLAELPRWIQQHKLTILGFVTPTFRHLLTLLAPGLAFAQVRIICIGGDTLYRQDVECYRQHFPPTCILYNSLGATETAGGFCAYLFDHTTPLLADPLPVGYPMVDMQMLILDEAGQLVADGTVGEIALLTPYLAQGYWRQPTQTAARFRATADGNAYATGDQGRLRADGCLIHLGRIDAQVKIRGYRVELGEIERTLLRHPAVREAVVVAHTREQGETQLVAYWVAQPAMDATRQALNTWLRAELPAYMLPSRFVALAALPLTPNGKVDRRALPAPDFTWARSGALTPSRTPTEQTLAELWCALLKLEQISVEDDFFQLGGHSLLAVRLMVQVEQQFQQTVPLRDFIFKPTIVQLASILDNSQISAPPETTLADDVALRLLYDSLEDRDKIHQLQSQLSPPGRPPRRLQMLLRLPKPVAMSLLYWLLHQPWVQQRYWPKQTALVQQFLAGLEAPPKQHNSVAQSLFFGFLTDSGLRHTIFRRLRTERSSIPFEGLAMLEVARAQQQGVILLSSHVYQAPYFRLLKLTQRGIEGLDMLIQPLQSDKTKAEHILYARQLDLAKQTLQQGGVIGIAPDVSRGYGTQVTVPFHGHLRPFRTSFAELALLTDAQLFFVASDLQHYNHFSFCLVGPFDRGSAALSHTERVQYLMEQYIALLRQQWAKNPWALPWEIMSGHLAYPPVDDAV